jgi:dihydroorotase
MMTLMNSNRLPDRFTTPGFVDMHVHFREPGSNVAETIASGSLTAAQSGYVLVADMPNNPGAPTWTEAAVIDKQQRIERSSYIPMAANIGSQPDSDNLGQLEAMSKRSLLYKIYAAATTGNHVDYQAKGFREAVAEWHRVAPEKPIGVHAGKENLPDFIGLIAGDYNHPMILHHVNNPEDVKTIIRAKKMGLDVSCAVTGHHIFKTSHDEVTDGWFARMMPELANQVDSEQLLCQLADGEIDAIETDHASHVDTFKYTAEAENPDGVVGPEETTCFGVSGLDLTPQLFFYQVERGTISMERLVDALSTQPARILGVSLDPNTHATWRRDAYRIDDEKHYARSGAGWTPYLGMMAVGRLETLTIQNRPIIAADQLIQRDGRYISDRGSTI